MTIPFRVKLLTPTAKAPTQENLGDLWDIYADNFCSENLKDLVAYGEKNGFPDFFNYFSNQGINHSIYEDEENGSLNLMLFPRGRILIRTGVAIELPVLFNEFDMTEYWTFNQDLKDARLKAYAVADIRPRSVEILERGLFVESKIIRDGEVSFIVINHGHKPITLTRGQSIAKMLIKPIYPTTMKIVDN